MILVIGGAGYIGSHTVKQLAKAGVDTVVFDNLSSGHKEFVKWGNFLQGDIRNKKQLRCAFRTYPIKAVIHFAAFAYVGESVIDPHKYYSNNVLGTINLLDVMLEHNVKTIVFSSTCATYGVPEILPLTEVHRQQPINPYGWSKLMIEQILKDYHRAYDLQYGILRYFNACGADHDNEIGEWHEPETHLIPNVLKAAAGELAAVQIFGTDYDTEDGTCTRDYIHVTDLADAHVRMLNHIEHNQQSDIFNLGTGAGFSVKEIIAMAEQVTGRIIPTLIQERRQGDPAILIADSMKARKILDWQPKYSDLSTVIQTAWDWHRQLSNCQLR